MTLSIQSKNTIVECLKTDFFQFIDEEYDQQLSELLADAALEFMTKSFGGKMDQDLENELAAALISNAYISL